LNLRLPLQHKAYFYFYFHNLKNEMSLTCIESLTQSSMSIAGRSLNNKIQSLNSAVRRRSRNRRRIERATQRGNDESPRRSCSRKSVEYFYTSCNILVLSYFIPKMKNAVEWKYVGKHCQNPRNSIKVWYKPYSVEMIKQLRIMKCLQVSELA